MSRINEVRWAHQRKAEARNKRVRLEKAREARKRADPNALPVNGKGTSSNGQISVKHDWSYVDKAAVYRCDFRDSRFEVEED